MEELNKPIWVNHQKRKNLNIRVPNREYVIDHIIPYCLSLDDSINNLQVIHFMEHDKKTIVDKRIIKEFRKNGWIIKITHYAHELLIPMNKLKEEYLKRYKELY